MPWIQAYTPVGGSLGMSALVAAIPLVVIFICLAVLKMKAHKAAPLAVLAAFAVAVTAWGMPADLAAWAFVQGAGFGLFPVFYIVLTTLFLYNITVKGGQFEIIRASLAGVTADRRIQALLIAFCFGAFIEGAAGFGTPVAIAGATLVGLGFRPLYAASVCLIANTAPVAFGAIGIPVVALGGVMGYTDDGFKLSKMVAHQLPFISIFIPFYVILIMVGLKKTLEVLPAVATCGITFALLQYVSASFLGPYLPDIIASLGSMAALVLLLQVWQPPTVYHFDHEEMAVKEEHGYTGGQIFRGWAPYLCLTVAVLLWGLPSVKKALDGVYLQKITVSGYHEKVVKGVSKPEDGLKKADAVKAEVDKLLAVLPATEPKLADAIAKLNELKGLEDKIIPIEQGLAGKGAVLTDERYAAFGAISKANGELGKMSAGLEKDNLIAKGQLKPLTKAVSGQLPIKIAAVYTFNFLSAAGTAILIAAFFSAILCGVGFGDVVGIFGKTCNAMKFPALTIACVLGLAYIMNTSGMTNSLGLIFTKTGHWFPFVSPFIGWLGVFLTGSDTSSNVLFGGLQKATGEALSINPVLLGAANTSGGVMGKMISPQSLAVACAACGMVGEEGTLFRFTLKHSIFLTSIVGVMVYCQAYYLQWMIP
jgi:lactate permease